MRLAMVESSRGLYQEATKHFDTRPHQAAVRAAQRLNVLKCGSPGRAVSLGARGGALDAKRFPRLMLLWERF